MINESTEINDSGKRSVTESGRRSGSNSVFRLQLPSSPFEAARNTALCTPTLAKRLPPLSTPRQQLSDVAISGGAWTRTHRTTQTLLCQLAHTAQDGPNRVNRVSPDFRPYHLKCCPSCQIVFLSQSWGSNLLVPFTNFVVLRKF
jgi:hypothetical protein